jgi:hypothetical protein
VELNNRPDDGKLATSRNRRPPTAVGDSHYGGMSMSGITKEKPIGTTKKIQALQMADEDMEWYPTTPEIMQAMEKDMWDYLSEPGRDYYSDRRREQVKIYGIGDGKDRLSIASFLDIGAGDGRVLDFFTAGKKYGIEIARTQADDLIRKGVFIIGRDYWDITLIDQYYSLIYSNPPFSQFEQWVSKILSECNFDLLYLVMPVRWKNQSAITEGLKRYEATVVGEFDFSQGDREARGKVNLVRVNAPWVKVRGDSHQQSVEDAFERWVRENIADFQKEQDVLLEEEEERALARMLSPIDQLIADYEREKETLGEAFRAIGKLDIAIINRLGQDKKSMLEIIRNSFESLKSKYWRIAFDKLEPVQTRMTQKTRQRIFCDIQEFKTLDFNADNIYSIVIWIINNSNIGILDQIGEVFDGLATKEYIEEYKSNRHWVKGDWRNAKTWQYDWKYKEFPQRWKLGLDYRIVVHAFVYDRYSGAKQTIVDDFIVICRNLGFPIGRRYKPDYRLHSSEQQFFTDDGELAFTMRYYTGNKNAHLKINKKLLMKFNIEVAKIRKWMSDPGDVVEEYGVSEQEAAQLWKSPLALVGSADVKMLEFKEAVYECKK